MDWRTIVITETNETFLISIANKSAGNFVFNLSDFKELWHEHIDCQEILSRARSENPFMNVDDDENAIERMIFSLANQYSLSLKGNERLLKTKYYIGGVPFHFQWKLTKSSSDGFFEEITKKLLVTLLNVEDQRNELIDIVKRKDVEISQYKIEGASLMRKHVATLPFLTTEFDKKFELNGGKFELRGEENIALYNTMKKLGNYDIYTKVNENTVSTNGPHCTIGPSPSKFVKYNKNKEENAIRKFNSRKESKIKYENSCELMSDDNVDMEQDFNLKSDVTGKQEQPKDVPKRKRHSKLNL